MTGDSFVRADLAAPEEVVWIARTLESKGFEAWAVGGAVRDALKGRVPDDWDLATSARPADVQRIFRRTVPVGIDHGTVGVLGKSGKLYEVTTYRRDVETDGRRAKVLFSDSLEEDLARRDFTINAVAWHPLHRQVRDPHGGMADLDAGVLRTVGEPELRFAEDRLRVLRALRFAGTFHMRIDPDTWTAIRRSAGKLGLLSVERVREELWKVLSSQGRPSVTLELYARSGVLDALFGELAATRSVGEGPAGVGLWDYLLAATDALPQSRPRLRLAALLHAIGWSDGQETHAPRSAAIARQLVSRLRFSNAVVDSVTHLIAQHEPLPAGSATDADIRRWIRAIGREHLRDLLRLRIAMTRANGSPPTEVANLIALHGRAAAILRQRPALEIRDLAIGGAELTAEDIRPGPRHGSILRHLLERVLDDPSANDRATLMNVVREKLADSS